VREVILDIRETILHKSVQILAQADDAVIVQIMKMQFKMHLTEVKWKQNKWVQ
jgi:uncharacterized SAM-dependent methyltransferase